MAVCVAFIGNTNQSAASFDTLWSKVSSCPIMRSGTTLRQPSSFEDLTQDARTGRPWIVHRGR